MIVIGYSADRFGAAALEAGIAEARWRQTAIRVINATSGQAYVDPRFARSGQIVDLATHLAETGVPFELHQPVGVDVVEELLEAMDHPGAELLVIGIRHRNPVGKLLMGSIAQQLILECPKPVLAVKADED